MAENIAPTTTANGDPTRGVPYYEKLKRDLRETLTKKRLLDKSLVFFFPCFFNLNRKHIQNLLGIRC